MNQTFMPLLYHLAFLPPPTVPSSLPHLAFLPPPTVPPCLPPSPYCATLPSSLPPVPPCLPPSPYCTILPSSLPLLYHLAFLPPPTVPPCLPPSLYCATLPSSLPLPQAKQPKWPHSVSQQGATRPVAPLATETLVSSSDAWLGTTYTIYNNILYLYLYNI